MNRIPLRVHLGTHADETAELCHWHVSEKHFLEAWSDARAYDGTASIVQPLIEPLYDSHGIHEVVQLFFRENFDKKDYDIVRAYWQTQNIQASAPAAATAAATATNGTNGTNGTNSSHSPQAANQPTVAATPTRAASAPTAAANTATNSQPAAAGAARTAGGARSFEDNWRKVVHDGVIPNSAPATRAMSANAGFLSQPAPPAAANPGSLEIAILPDPSIYDGRFTNNGWLQELPNPITKITWENVALVSPKTAEKLNLNRGNDPEERSGGERPPSFITSHGSNMYSDLVTLNYQGGTISKNVPVWIAPGQPDDVVTIFMGYGRTRS